MKFTKTAFDLEINNSSSWTIYLTKTFEEAETINRTLMTQRETLKDLPGWYFRVMTIKVEKACMVPEFFHNRDYWATCIEHNNGDWNRAPVYTLYIAE